MKDLLQQSKVLVVLGQGGVGKTSFSAGLAIDAARMGRRVFVLTIDPSRRLKDLFGLPANGETVSCRIPAESGQSSSLDAAVINHQEVFRSFVMRVLNSSKLANEDRIKKADALLGNRLFQELMTNLSGSQEFSCLQRLYEARISGKYDLVILDTPPANHAIEFLQAPDKLMKLFRNGVLQWFVHRPDGGTNLIKKFFERSTRMGLEVLSRLTGAQFFEELSDFFQQIQDWGKDLEERLNDFQRLLADQGTRFIVVTGNDMRSLRSTESLVEALSRQGHRPSAVIANRMVPAWLSDDESVKDMDQAWTKLYTDYSNYVRFRKKEFELWATQARLNCHLYLMPEVDRSEDPLVDLSQYVPSLIRL